MALTVFVRRVYTTLATGAGAIVTVSIFAATLAVDGGTPKADIIDRWWWAVLLISLFTGLIVILLLLAEDTKDLKRHNYD